MDDYPSLDEITRQTERFDEMRHEKKSINSNQNDNRRYNQRNDSYRNNDRQDAYRRDERQDNRQQQNGDRRGGFNNNRRREDDIRRPGQSDYRGSGDARNQSYENDRYNRNNSTTQGFRKAHDTQRQDARFTDPPRNNRGGYQNQNQSSHNRPQHSRDNAVGLEPKEFTNSSYKNRDDRTKRGSYEDESHGAAGDAGDPRNSKNVVISNKENVQTINVTITTTEKKSYAKERRGKGIPRLDEGASHFSSPDTSRTGKCLKLNTTFNPIQSHFIKL